MSMDSLLQTLSVLPDGWHLSPHGRRLVTYDRPDVFSYVYLRHHLRGPETAGRVTYADCHHEWYQHMAQWQQPVGSPRDWRRAYVAPRASAKTTHWYLFAPLWSLAHGHSRFVAAFADAATQAETHLATLRKELMTNTLLRTDYPDLCTPAGTFDNRTTYQSKSGAVFAARGIDAASLGLKMGERRPDVLIFDDVEKGEGTYSAWQAAQRLKTIQDVVLPLNESARAVLVGTVTMPGSIVHQMVRGKSEWVKDDNWSVYHYPALYDSYGNPKSIWPEKWSVEYLLSIQHTRGFAKNFMNEPLTDDGDYWKPEDIRYTDSDEDYPRTMLSIDPAVSDKRTSDNSAVALLSQRNDGRVVLRGVTAVKATGRDLRAVVERLLLAHPEIRVVLVEVNQGGDLWKGVFAGLPVLVRTTWSSEPKPVRAARLLEDYQAGRVLHQQGWDDRETVQELCAFPRGINDDRVDAIGAGARYFIPQKSSRLRIAVS